jgi:Transglycosylase SLT domain
MTESALLPVRPGRLCLAALIAAFLGAGSAANAHDNEAPWTLCSQAVAQVEDGEELPEYMLAAIALVESGRWHKDSEEILAWPWTITAEGRGRYLPSKAAALAEIKALKAKGISNIDVGCMQINLLHHPKAFEDLDAALDPARNVAYAAQLLRSLRQQRGSWTRAVGDYHSTTPSRSGPYRVKVFQALFAERSRARQARRAAR